MKLLAHFRQILDDTVNMNATRLDQLGAASRQSRNFSNFKWDARSLRVVGQSS